MAWTTPNTWTAALVTVSQFNTYIRDNFLAVFPAGPAWTAVSFSAGNFTGNGSMTWTVASGDQAVFSYVEIGKTMVVTVNVVTSTVGGTPASTLQIKVPNSRTIGSAQASGSFHYIDNGAAGTGLWVATAGGTTISLFKTALAPAWTASTDNTYVYGTFVFEIV